MNIGEFLNEFYGFLSTIVARAMSVRVTIPTGRFRFIMGSFLTLFLNMVSVASLSSMSGFPVITCLVIISETLVFLGVSAFL